MKMVFQSDKTETSPQGTEMVSAATAEHAASAGAFDFSKVLNMAKSMNPALTLSLFLIYFLGGYLLYASLFAAIGAAIDNETDSQQSMFPITIPIIIALYVAMAAFRNPHSDKIGRASCRERV